MPRGAPHRPELGRVSVAHGDDELRADEDRDLPEHDRLRLVDVASRPQDKEQVVAVVLELRALMSLDGILDRELVEIELARDRCELLLAGFVEAEPRDRIAGLAGGVQLGKAVGLCRALAVAIDGAVDDHASRAISPRIAAVSCGFDHIGQWLVGMSIHVMSRSSAMPASHDGLCSSA